MFNNLAALASQRADLAKAGLYVRESLEIGENLAPGSLVVASDLVNFGNLMQQRGNVAKAEESYRRAFVIFKLPMIGGIAAKHAGT